MLCLFMVLSVCELAVRVRAQFRYGKSQSGGIVDSLLVVDEKTGLNVPRAGLKQRGNLVSLSINELGFRGESFDFQKPKGTIRIACVGASTTFCAEASDDDATWPAQLQRILNERHEAIFEVINAGVPGYMIDDSLVNLRERVLPLNPDLAIIYHANNDMAKDTRALAQEQGITKDNRDPAIVQFVAKYSMLVDLAYKNIKILFKGSGQKKLDAIPSDIASRFSARLNDMHLIASNANCRVLVSHFATKYRSHQTPAEQKKNADVAFYYMPWMTAEQLVATLDRYNQAITDFASQTNTPIITEIDSIPADEEHFADCMHLRDVGCEKMAMRFANFLEESGLVDELTDELSSLKTPVQEPSTIIHALE